MITLKNVLIFKIVVTILFWITPTLFFSEDWIEYLGFPRPSTMLWIRLLSVEFIALVVGYSFGLYEVINGRKAIWVVWMGIVSNTGASLILLWYLVFGQFPTCARLLILGSLMLAIVITIGFVYTGLLTKPK